MLKQTKGKATQPPPTKCQSTRSIAATSRSNNSNSATTETSQRRLKLVLRLPVQAKHPHDLRCDHATPATPNPRTDFIMTFVFECKLSNHPDLLSGLLMTSAMPASISKHVYAKCQLNFSTIVNAYATQKIKWHAVCRDPSNFAFHHLFFLPTILLNFTYYPLTQKQFCSL